jgi:hypothetical protein
MYVFIASQLRTEFVLDIFLYDMTRKLSSADDTTYCLAINPIRYHGDYLWLGIAVRAYLCLERDEVGVIMVLARFPSAFKKVAPFNFALSDGVVC